MTNSSKKSFEIVVRTATYALTLESEFSKNFSILDGEKIEFKDKHKKGIIALTNKRILFLKHRIIGNDKIFSIPLNKIKRLTLIKRNYFIDNDTIIELDYGIGKLNFQFRDVLESSLGWGKSDTIKNQYFFDILSDKLPKNISSTK